MRFFSFAFFTICIAASRLAEAQAGCSDAGACTLGGHSSEIASEELNWSASISETVSGEPQSMYAETALGLARKFEGIELEAGVNYRWAVSRVSFSGETIGRRHGFGDARVQLSLAIDTTWTAHLAGTMPLAQLELRSPQRLQSSLGVPSLLAGVSYEWRESPQRFGATLAYSTTFRKENALLLERAEDLALVFRTSREGGAIRFGADASAIAHVARDRIDGEAIDSTLGVTVNLGVSISYALSQSSAIAANAAIPIVGIKHIDGLERKYVVGLRGSISF